MAKRMAKAFQGARGKVKKIIERLTAWSFSRWADYEKCPAYCRFKHIMRLREPDNPAMANGTIVHQVSDHFVRGTLKKFPKELVNFKTEYTALRDARAMTEQEWAFNADYERVTWMASDAWLRVKVDAHYLQEESVRKGRQKVNQTTVIIIDYKTGKNKPDHAMQRSLYALGGFLMYPDAVAVVAEHWYIDSGEIESDEYTLKDLVKLKKQWEQRTRAMLADTTFAPRPGRYCQWCHFSRGKGGPCKF